MDASWYMMHIRPEGKKIHPTGWPLVGQHVVYHLGAEGDEENPFWPLFQDNVRPAWAPDFLRLGYVVVFRRDALPKLAVKLGIRNPVKLKKEDVDPNTDGRSDKRILTFDDVFVIGVVPSRMPMFCPDVKLKPEEWWLATKDGPKPTSPFLSPGGATVVVGAERLADVVVQILRTPNGYPRPLPTEGGLVDYSEFINPLVPVLPKAPPDVSDANGAGAGGTDMGYAGVELFRY